MSVSMPPARPCAARRSVTARAAAWVAGERVPAGVARRGRLLRRVEAPRGPGPGPARRPQGRAGRRRRLAGWQKGVRVGVDLAPPARGAGSCWTGTREGLWRRQEMLGRRPESAWTDGGDEAMTVTAYHRDQGVVVSTCKAMTARRRIATEGGGTAVRGGTWKRSDHGAGDGSAEV